MTKIHENKDNSFVQIGTLGKGILLSSLSLFMLGLGFLFFPSLFPSAFIVINTQTNEIKKNEIALSVFSNISSALLSAGVLTLTLEVFSQFQRKQDFNNMLQELNDKSIEKFIQEIVGDEAIFEQVKNHIFYRDYIKEYYNFSLRFIWHDSEKEYLKNQLSCKYKIVNLRNQKTQYKLIIRLEQENNDIFPGTTKVLKVKYTIKDSNSTVTKEEDFTGTKLEEEIQVLPDREIIEFQKVIEIPPKGSVECELENEAIVDKQLRYPILSLNNSKSMAIKVTHHPEDLSITAIPIHPSIEELKTVTNDIYSKEWKMDVGLLPGQGIQIQWKPTQQSKLNQNKQAD